MNIPKLGPAAASPTSTDSALDSDYRQAGFNARLPFGERPALIVVDLARAYFEEGAPLYAPAFAAAIEPNRRLVAAARAAGIPVVFTAVVYAADGHDGGLFFKKVPALKAFVKGSPLSDFPEGLGPLPHETLLAKQYASAFFGTSLASTLNARRVDTVLITGYSTSGCVRATALDALQSGFAPFVVSDACADRDPRPHEANLFDLQNKYAEVIDTAEALQALSRLGMATNDRLQER